MLNSKQRLTVLILGTLVFVVPALINQILILTNSPLNPTNVNLYQTSTTIKYVYEPGEKDPDEKTLEFDITADEDKGVTEVEGSLDKHEFKYKVDYETGEILNKDDTYTLFWIPVTNPMLSGWNYKDEVEYDVMDTIGLLGVVNEKYTLIVGEPKVYWDVPPKLAGAQFSFVIELFDENDTKVADGLMDSTCGFLEILEGGKNNIKLTIESPGNFAISRNRNQMLLWGIVCGIAFPIVAFFVLKKKGVDKKTTEEFVLMLAVGSSVVLVDIDIDVWFYAALGQTTVMILHLGLCVAYMLICLRLKIGIKWAFPAFLEVAFVFAMTNFVGDPYVPHITAFMGLYASYLAMLFASGMEKRGYESKLDIFV